MTPERMIELIESVQSKAHGPRVVRGYNGRGMLPDESCIAFSTDAPVADTALIVANVADLEEAQDIANVFKGARTDSFGRGTIVYFPRLRDLNPPTVGEDADLCAACRVSGHDTCPLVGDDCRCCADTASRLAEQQG